MTTPRVVAEFMVEELNRARYLYQETIVGQIDLTFGAGFTGTNAAGNSSINSNVLAAFNELTPDVVWERGTRMWRFRESYDKPGRQQ